MPTSPTLCCIVLMQEWLYSRINVCINLCAYCEPNLKNNLNSLYEFGFSPRRDNISPVKNVLVRTVTIDPNAISCTVIYT